MECPIQIQRMNDPSVCPSGITVDGIVLDRWIGKFLTSINIFIISWIEIFQFFVNIFLKKKKQKTLGIKGPAGPKSKICWLLSFQ